MYNLLTGHLRDSNI